MVNSEHKLTVDDLIVEYMIYKVENLYEPSFTIGEFINFLLYFESKITVYDTLYDGEKLFKRFFERKNEHDWFKIVKWNPYEKVINPHMDMIYISKDTSYIIKANYKLNLNDKQNINTYYMDDYKGDAFKIRCIIGEWLKDHLKRTIDESIEITQQDKFVGKYIAAKIITIVWNSYIDKLIEIRFWPMQCKDINKYLFELDLADIICIESKKDDLIELYDVLTKRIAILYHQDKNLKICSNTFDYLAQANYKLLIHGYEDIMSIAFEKYKKSLEIDFSTFTFQENHEINELYNEDDYLNIKITNTPVKNETVKRLIRNLDKVNKTIILNSNIFNFKRYY